MTGVQTCALPISLPTVSYRSSTRLAPRYFSHNRNTAVRRSSPEDARYTATTGLSAIHLDDAGVKGGWHNITGGLKPNARADKRSLARQAEACPTKTHRYQLAGWASVRLQSAPPKLTATRRERRYQYRKPTKKILAGAARCRTAERSNAQQIRIS